MLVGSFAMDDVVDAGLVRAGHKPEDGLAWLGADTDPACGSRLHRRRFRVGVHDAPLIGCRWVGTQSAGSGSDD